ncbi:tricarboxylate transport protein, mitochondrial precursor [Pyrenophora tritici-repentis Pt-1C-BFP]|uniref:Tricarboxylate transport protein, mitochondrial n=1 Tax=Pyrenophora tritici-repentis (strain Pt-1C-BFP) TaxID=426418 RepID=B2WMB1_PYRTR|nr:tricarboxylate transport protein, mitochondrial precursor [Pyrenophora tritici-repentis Pt-1C-BFP]EDU44171.1 tricarboxylate transport protein, mitochondrial precursor [Pyrenophora tritici-repentis Pt-1C-BFP]
MSQTQRLQRYNTGSNGGRSYEHLLVNMQTAASRNAYQTARNIIQKDNLLGLYRGFSPVILGIVPKIAIRFASFETYKSLLALPDGSQSSQRLLLAGLAAGVTESILVVTPMEMVKIRLQSQKRAANPQRAIQVVLDIVRNEGIRKLWTGISLTLLRQGTNQAGTPGKPRLGIMKTDSSPPLAETRVQKSPSRPGESSFRRIVHQTSQLVTNEGLPALYRGIGPRILRVDIGQAVSFTAYEFLIARITLYKVAAVESIPHRKISMA